MQILFGLNLPFSFFAFYANFLFFNCVIHYFGLQVHAARLILSLVFVGSPVLICVHIIVPCLLWGDKRLMLPSPHHIITFVLLEESTVHSVCFGDPKWIHWWFMHCLLRVAHSSLFTEVVFIVFHFIASAKVFAGSSLSLSRHVFKGSSLVSIRQTDVTSSDLRWTSSVYASASYRKNKYGGHCLV